MRASLAFLLLLLALVPVPVRADALDDGVRRVALQLQCPVCEGQSIADSNSGLAADMRAVIRTKLSAGEPDAQIVDEFVASYGDGILSEPPKRGISLGVWLGPLLGLAMGGALLAALLVGWRRPNRARATRAALDPTVTDEFARFREELGA